MYLCVYVDTVSFFSPTRQSVCLVRCDHKMNHSSTVPLGKPATIKNFILWLCENAPQQTNKSVQKCSSDLILCPWWSQPSDLEWYCCDDGNALLSNFRILSQKAPLTQSRESNSRQLLRFSPWWSRGSPLKHFYYIHHVSPPSRPSGTQHQLNE